MAFYWLLEVICELSVSDIDLPPDSKKFLIESISVCLLNIRGMPYVGVLSGNFSAVPSSAQELFLDTLQRRVFYLSQRIESIYVSIRAEEITSTDDFDLNLLNISE